MSDPVVTMCPCGTKYRHERGAWSGEYPLSKLDGWIEFYRREAKKRPKVYSPDLKALSLFRTLEVGA